MPFDDKLGVIRNAAGRVVDQTGNTVAGLYATGWIKRGPIGLIGHTKSDALETIENLLADIDQLVDPVSTESATAELQARGVRFTNWQGWLKLNEHELALGAADSSHVTRERVKVVSREEQVAISNLKD